MSTDDEQASKASLSIKTFIMEVYIKKHAFAIYQLRDLLGNPIPNTMSVECLDGSKRFLGQRFKELSEVYQSIEASENKHRF